MAKPARRDLEAIGGRISEQRKLLGLTQAALAERVGVSKSFVSDLESGNTQASGLVYLRLAQCLDLPLEHLLTGEETQAPRFQPREVPEAVARLAEEQGWSYAKTVDIASAVTALVARRTASGRSWQPSREQILRIAEAVDEEEP
jgi:transcriptional regulator with XRE-family HTH domain